MKGWNRNKVDIISGLKNENDKEAYELFLELEKQAAESDILYGYFDDFMKLINDDNSFVQIRGFRLVCAQAKWDVENKIEKNLNNILYMLANKKSIVIRQCITSLHTVIFYKPDLAVRIEQTIKAIE